ncbi:hypothetical protein [Wolbachia endosymbiont of Cantharis cryptica]|uniref:hypothetical protein n=1 Tax=Wolbachia endosymbiont of Cantharis cryptica TaxID=3066132 RepID=UPI00376F0AAE
MKGARNRHDCANDGTCGQSIQSGKRDGTNFSFFDNSGNLIAKIPILPKYSVEKYRNQLYKEAESKQFNYSPTDIHDVLPNSFIVKYGYINCTIKYNNLSEQEQSQIETDIKTAYEAFKEKFCLENSNASYDITIYIFNNRSDYTKYNDLLGINEDGGPGYITRGVTDYKNILTYKQDSMDFILGHELGHLFQLRFSPSVTVQTLHILDTELIANVVGREVEEKNNKAICEQMGVDEYEDRGWMFQFKYKGTLYKYHKNLSEEEKFKAIQNAKNIHELVDEYEDHGSMFSFKYKGTTFSIYRKDLSEEEKFQIIQNARNIHELVDEYEDRGSMLKLKYKGTTFSIYRKDLSEEEKLQFIQHVKNIHELVDEYKDYESMFSFQYKGTTFSIYRKDLSEEEKLQFIKDIKNSHESLVGECDGLGDGNTTLLIYVDENNNINKMHFYNYEKNISKRLDKTLISRSKPEQDVDETDPKPEKEPEPRKEPEEDTQQPSNFLSNIILGVLNKLCQTAFLIQLNFQSSRKENIKLRYS